MSESEQNYSRVDVVLVHGIGDMEAGSALDPVVLEVGRQLDGLVQTGRTKSSGDTGAAVLHKQSVRWQQIQMDFTEFHWSGSSGKIKRLKIFSSLAFIFTLLWNLPRMGAWGSGSRLRHAFATVFGTYFVTCLFGITFLSVWAMSADYFEFLTPTSFTFESLDAILLLVLFGSFFPALAIFLVLTLVNRTITQWAAQWLGVVIANVMLFYFWMILAIAFALMLVLVTEIVDTNSVALALLAVLFVPLAMIPYYLVVVLMAAVADLMRDVFHYLAVDRRGNEHRDTLNIKSALHELLDSLIRNGSGHIVIVSHSLGTAITVEVLSERIGRPGQEKITFELVTCGSPLRRFLSRLLPQRVPDPDLAFDRFRSQDSFVFGRWLNLYRIKDPVGKSLSRRASENSSAGASVSTSIEDILITPTHEGPTGHPNYWGDKRFHRILTESFLKPLGSATTPPS